MDIKNVYIHKVTCMSILVVSNSLSLCILKHNNEKLNIPVEKRGKI